MPIIDLNLIPSDEDGNLQIEPPNSVAEVMDMQYGYPDAAFLILYVFTPWLSIL
jgi:hypothetical protein